MSTPLPPSGHDPVMPDEILDALRPQPGQTIVDCTVGRGGHSSLIARRLAPLGTLVGLDYDPRNLEYASTRLAAEVPDCPARLFHANFAELPDALADAGVGPVQGIFADLGISTNQLFDAQYGLSFASPGRLDMRLDPRTRLTAEQIVNNWSDQKIADTLFQLADERYSRRIARKIVEARQRSPIKTTEQLAELVRGVVPRPRKRGPGPEIDTATRTFMALRMAVNTEVENLTQFLRDAPGLLAPGGRLVVLSFHSGEDRLVKQAFRAAEQAGHLKVVTSKPLVPTDAEVARNPRSRSAKLRVAEKPGLGA